jgi:hypothetical protein
VAARIVESLRNASPSYRFLKMIDDGKWFDIGDVKAIGKV